MRISCKKKQECSEGSTRTVTRFLWFPMVINQEMRWLEKSSWEEERRKYHLLPVPGAGYSPGDNRWILKWVATEWMK